MHGFSETWAYPSDLLSPSASLLIILSKSLVMMDSNNRVNSLQKLLESFNMMDTIGRNKGIKASSTLEDLMLCGER